MVICKYLCLFLSHFQHGIRTYWREGKSAMVLAKKLLAWCPMDNLGIRLLLGDISWLAGDTHAAMKHYLAEAPTAPAHWYQAGLIALRAEDFVAACTYLRRGIAANRPAAK